MTIVGEGSAASEIESDWGIVLSASSGFEELAEIVSQPLTNTAIRISDNTRRNSFFMVFSLLLVGKSAYCALD